MCIHFLAPTVDNIVCVWVNTVHGQPKDNYFFFCYRKEKNRSKVPKFM